MTIVDGDGHVTENTEMLARYIDPAYRDYGPIAGARSYYPNDGWEIGRASCRERVYVLV